MLREIAALEAACRKVHELAQAMRPIVRDDPNLEYFDCMSCINLHFILASRSQAKEAQSWLVEANQLVPADFAQVEDPRRRDQYSQIRDEFEKVHPKKK